MQIYNNITYVYSHNNLYQISGELYKVNEKTMEKINKHKGIGIVYSKLKIKVITDKGKTFLCYMYIKYEDDGMMSLTGNYKDDVYPCDFKSLSFLYMELLKKGMEIINF